MSHDLGKFKSREMGVKMAKIARGVGKGGTHFPWRIDEIPRIFKMSEGFRQLQTFFGVFDKGA